MTDTADPGDRVTIVGTWTAEGAPSPNVACHLRKPDGTVEELAGVDVDTVGQVVTAVAVYDVPRANTAAGWYHVDWVVTGNPVSGDPDSFYVRRSAVLS